ncbi:MAG TPA: PaaX family transcriptional regulator C-terminal domain-containing protein, partial [Kofleriaceae bacterium]|nr:PaaX family transcriptional regulator C-terminal domain-containing protein [Kofleriaceae bacterium]
RALRVLGLRALEPGVYARPDNLTGGVAALRDRLYALGACRDAPVVRASELDAASDARARRLWERDRLSAGYVALRERIERWLVEVAALPTRSAAREAFWFGGDVLRAIMLDPRLPEPLVDVAARRALVEAAARLDATGRRIWAELFGVAFRIAPAPEEARHVH